ncbi:type I polyketide synthase [Actinomadura opuntiae]|uniref:type I polyketide synthase n=1 Tax=Actinomadura sp. OS1-43 TaxID=604315 RepID=UPI00255B40BF|nr:type I polyketide synthase [Actinomadura sp. OS1-43]MDL4815435.1 SDR family NAD(P)-dependent oxidoreductase [Actinomadura sp. OS1-43]
MENQDKLREYLRRATTDLRQARRRLREQEDRAHEPIAIVAMSCRYPGGVSSPEDLWELVVSGRDAIGPFPEDRGWELAELYDPDPDRSGRTYVTEGGFVDGAAGFDAAFFEISPREALATDPQQRLLLETAWEAFERAGLDPAALRGSRTGVYAGVINQNYAMGAEGFEGHIMTGTLPAVASGRVAYTFGLEGPALSIDTACSSSLVAVHEACQALRLGECDLALAGGVTIMATPGAFVEFSRQRGLAPDGRCKPFAAAADGTGWGEGAGLLLVERLSDARRHGHPVLALIRGSAINQDGASNGLTAPNGPSQQRVIRQALADARLLAADIDAVEGHGTGTTLGDPIEAQALLATYGRGRDRPLWLGSVKSNLGHTQAAAGVAGIIKMVMGMRNGELARSLHVDAPSPHVDWSAGNVALLSRNQPWPDGGRPRRAAVSSFGISGTNGHVILEQAPSGDPEPSPAGPGEEGPGEARPGEARPAPKAIGRSTAVAWPVSARSEDALRAQAARLREFVLGDPDADPADVGFSLATTRATLEHRAVAVGAGRQELLQSLAELAAGGEPAAVVRGESLGRPGKTVFVFPGQGGQWAGMAAGLLESSPVFRERIEECSAALAPHVDWSLTDVLTGAPGAASLERVDVVQPALFAVMVALAELWRAAGVRPDAVLGHSQGEIAAACVAGALSLEDAARVVALRSRALVSLAGTGGMASVALPADRVRPMLTDGLSVAAVNGPGSTVVSGDPGELDGLLASCEADGVRARRIPVDYASHSAQVAALHDRLLAELAGIEPRAADIVFCSTVTGEPVDTAALDAGYWFRNLRQEVLFEPAVRALAERGHRTFVEVSPHPVLTGPVQETLEDAAAAGVVVGSLRRDHGGWDRFLTSLAEAHVQGAAVDWEAVFAGTGARRIELPTYAFQRERYWLAAAGPRRGGAAIDDWQYRVAWRPVSVPPRAELPGNWLVAVPAGAGGPVDECLAWLLRDGAPKTVAISPADGRDEVAARLREAAGDEALTGVVSLLALDERPHPEHPSLGSGQAATALLVRALGEAGLPGRLWLLTRGAVRTGRGGDAPAAPAQAAVWGLGRTVALEEPDRWGGLIDLPADLDDDALERVRALLDGGTGEDQVAVRGAEVRACRMVRAPAGAAPRTWRPTGTALVTGGTGALGAHVARWLARAGCPRLVLLSRRGPDAPGAAELAAELTETGTQVTVAACDVTDRSALERLLAGLPADEPVTAVVHAAGEVTVETPLAETGAAELAAVMHAKVTGAAHLDELLGDVDAFVLFSSGAGLWGNAGQGAYGAANAYLDGLAAARRARGLRATSVAWGAWAAGMVDEAVADLLRRRGVPTMDPDQAIAALQRALDRDETHLAVADFDWDRFVPAYTMARPRPLLDELPEVQRILRAEDGADSSAREGLRRRLLAAAEAERDAMLLDLVRAHAAATLGHQAPEAIPAARAFKELGFDSVAALEFRKRLNAATGLRLPTTVVFDEPTPEALAARLRAEVLDGPDAGPAAASAAGPAAAAAGPGEPIAVVGMACRYPGGVRSPEDLWRLLVSETDAIGAFPADRGWDLEALYDPDPGHPGTSYVREGGFLYDAGDFDAGFFGISPREAAATDPQQRLLLETAWEAVERAGIDPASLRGSATGVFAGVISQEYTPRGVAKEFEGYLLTGNTASVASGRVAYTLGLAGPAVTIDTACSSSLVALHLACQALRDGDCTLALAGGATVMATPGLFTEFSRQRGLAPDARCKSFAAQADGTAFAEGAGLLLVERLSDAERNGHPVLAVIRGSAINQDGASNGLAAPSGPAQREVIRRALAAARLAPGEVDAVEAHGTGTALGDPIEAHALLAAYGGERDAPLRLGSIKSNIGHAQAAAGAAGVIKMVMALRHGLLPRTLHAAEASPHIAWATGSVELLTEAAAWPRNGRPRRAGVSAFGISGTNAHVILEEAPPAEDTGAPAEDTGAPAADEPGPGEGLAAVIPWTLSAASEDALAAQARRLLSHLREHPGLAPQDVGFSLATTRAVLPHRAVLLGDDRDELLRELAALASGETPRDGSTGAAGPPAGTAFLFTGQGSQRPGMGAELYRAFPAYAEALDAVCACLDEHLDRPARDLVFAGPLDRTEHAQPAIFAVEVALFRLVESWGLRPDHLIGHSVGELAAAHVAGMLSLPDACALVAARGRLMQAAPETGAMAAVQASEEEMAPLLAGLEDAVSLAAVNGPGAVVVSGDAAEVARLADHWRAAGRRTKRLAVSHAFHSPHMEPVLEDFRRVARSVSIAPPSIPIVSNVTGRVAGAADLRSPDYWVRHMRETVRFADGMRTLWDRGVRRFVELGPDAVLSAMGRDCLPEDGAVIVPALRAGRREDRTLVAALGAAHVAGAPVDWSAPLAGLGGRRVDLPTYAFQRKRYWLTPGRSGDPAALALTAAGHPVLGAVLGLADDDRTVLTGSLALRDQPWLGDHAVAGTVILPGTAFVEMALEAGRHTGCARIDDLTLEIPLAIPADGDVRLQVIVGPPDGSGRRPVGVHSGSAEGTWTRHAAGFLAEETGPVPAGELKAWPPPGAAPLDADGLYDRLADAGFDYGPLFQGVRSAWRDGETLYAEVALPEGGDADGFGIHPALLDAALHPLALAAGAASDQPDTVRLPFSWSAVTAYAAAPTEIRVRLVPAGPDALSMTVADTEGRTVLEVGGLVMRPVAANRLGAGAGDALFHVAWTPVPVPEDVPQATAAVVGDTDPGVSGTRHPDLRSLAAAGPVPETVYASLPDQEDDAAFDALDLVRTWLGDERFAASRLVVVTRGALAVRDGEGVPGLGQAAVWGLVRSAQSESGDRLVLVDLDEDPASAAVLPAVPATGEPQLAVRQGVLHVPRLARVPSGAPPAPAGAAPDPDGTVLITGGTGTLGALVARHLVTAHGMRHLLLASRSGPEAGGAAALAEELGALGADVRIAACDTADRAALADLIASIPADRPLTAVVHTAGVLDDGLVTAITPERLEAVLRAKARSARHLHDLTRDADLRSFVLFSSLAGTVGNPGQANYAAGNTFLDALAQHRHSLGLPATALAWGPWAQAGGMAGEHDRARLGRAGVTPMAAEEALDLFDAALATGLPALVPARFDLAALRALASAGPLPAVLRGLVRRQARRAATGDLAARLADLPEDKRDAYLLNEVRTHVAAVLGHPGPEAVEAERPFSELGMDSMAAVELRDRLASATALRLPATLVFDHPTPAVLAAQLRAELGGTAAPAEPPVLGELDRLAAVLTGLPPADDGTDAAVTTRLQTLLSLWLDRRAETGGAAEVSDRIETASADEIFDFIDQELGRGAS